MAGNSTIVTEGLTVKTDMYNGYTIDSKHLKFDNLYAEFEQKLPGALATWKNDGIKGVWIKVRTTHSELVSICTKLGFDFHHAQAGYVMLVKWLPEYIENRIPGFANQYLGVAGFVINEKNQLLVIQEKYNMIKKHWKLPGGLADSGEDLELTAKREVFEETGIKTEFVDVLTFRHQHQFRYGCSDWYFVCLMKPINEDIKPCPHEIADCKWIDIDEYLQDENITDMNRYVVQCYKDHQTKHRGFGILPKDVLSYDKKSKHKLYSIQQLSEQDLH